ARARLYTGAVVVCFAGAGASARCDDLAPAAAMARGPRPQAEDQPKHRLHEATPRTAVACLDPGGVGQPFAVALHGPVQAAHRLRSDRLPHLLADALGEPDGRDDEP